MKKFTKWLGIIAFVAIIGFGITGCDNGGGTDNGSTDNNGNGNGNGSGQDNQAPDTQQPFRDITAMQLVSEIKIGWNLSNTLDATDYGDGWLNKNGSISSLETAWGVPVTTKTMIDNIKAAGFNAIRIPVTWSKVAGSAPNYTIRSDWMARVTEVVNYAAANDMYILLNTHHDELHHGTAGTSGFFGVTNATKNLAAFQKIWEQIAGNFKNYNEKLIFEGLNEPRTVGTAYEWSGGNAEERGVINKYYQTFVNTVRASGGNNDKRFLMLNTHAASGSAEAINGLVIPNDSASNKIIVSIHVYEPYTFSYNRGTAVSWDKNNTSHTSPITNPIDRVYDKFVSNGIPVIIGEFASSKNNNINDRVEWTKFYVNYAMSKGLRCFVWDCGVDDIFWNFDRSANTWKYPQVRDALIQTANSSITEPQTPPTTSSLGNYFYGGASNENLDQAVWALSPVLVTVT
uniref:Glycoside hydrolase family 5 n=1 Tax=uncultured bacterium contig00037 TaxID=1181525 RepID=A0A806JY72_9BACT|nr:glycoside hydrolase family 5 [uncultured bacterium contig00037]